MVEYYSSRLLAFFKPILVVIPIAIAVVILVLIVPTLVMVPNYRIEVDAMKVQDLVQISNVRITNTGKLPVTGLSVNMGGVDIQFFDKLEPGKTIWISPRAETLETITVSTREGVFVTKDFREPISMVAFGPS
jgi:hypothetical protein